MIHLSRAMLHVIISLADQLEPVFKNDRPDIETALAADDDLADCLRLAPLFSREFQT